MDATRKIKQILDHIRGCTIGIGFHVQSPAPFITARGNQIRRYIVFCGNGRSRPGPPFLETTVVQGITIAGNEAFTIVFPEADASQVFTNAAIVLGLNGCRSAQRDAQQEE